MVCDCTKVGISIVLVYGGGGGLIYDKVNGGTVYIRIETIEEAWIIFDWM